jgi:hypothetical protein
MTSTVTETTPPPASANDFVMHQVPMVYNILHQFMKLFWTGVPSEDAWCQDILGSQMERLEKCRADVDPSLLVELAGKCTKEFGTLWKNKDAKTLFQAPVHPIIQFIGGERLFLELSETDRDSIYWTQIKSDGTTCNLISALIESCIFVEIFLTDLMTLDMSEMFSSRANIESSINGIQRIFDAAVISKPKKEKKETSEEEKEVVEGGGEVDLMSNLGNYFKKDRETREANQREPLEVMKELVDSMKEEMSSEEGQDEFIARMKEMKDGQGEFGEVYEGLQLMLSGKGSKKDFSSVMENLLKKVTSINDVDIPPGMVEMISSIAKDPSTMSKIPDLGSISQLLGKLKQQ